MFKGELVTYPLEFPEWMVVFHPCHLCDYGHPRGSDWSYCDNSRESRCLLTLRDVRVSLLLLVLETWSANHVL
jgi:hypothetical protein